MTQSRGPLDGVKLLPVLPRIPPALLTDPQTRGGLLVWCAPGALDDVLAIFRCHSFAQSAAIGNTAARQRHAASGGDRSNQRLQLL